MLQGTHITPVSYTHLDVYKRQAGMLSAASVGPVGPSVAAGGGLASTSAVAATGLPEGRLDPSVQAIAAIATMARWIMARRRGTVGIVALHTGLRLSLIHI